MYCKSPRRIQLSLNRAAASGLELPSQLANINVTSLRSGNEIQYFGL